MSIKFACTCGKAYKVPEDFSGRRVKCKQCGEAIRVPSQSQSSVVSTRAAAVSKRSVLDSERLGEAAAGKSGRTSGSGSSARSGRSSSGRSSSSSGRTASSSGRSASSSGRSSSSSGRSPARASSGASTRPKKASPGSGTQRLKAIDLNQGNQLKQFQRKRDEEFRRGEGRLTYFEDGKPKKAFKISKKEATIGRGESCTVSLDLPSLSREHARIEYKLGTFIATDLQSTNGMVVNGRAVRRSSLKSGDIVQLGEVILRLDY